MLNIHHQPQGTKNIIVNNLHLHNTLWVTLFKEPDTKHCNGINYLSDRNPRGMSVSFEDEECSRFSNNIE